MASAQPKSATILAWFAIVNGVLTLATPLFATLFGQHVPLQVIVIILVLGFLSGLCGFYGRRANTWAFWLLFVLFLLQSAEYFSQTFSFSFVGPLNFKFGWGWYNPPSRFNINLLAIVVCIWAAYAARCVGALRAKLSGSAAEA